MRTGKWMSAETSWVRGVARGQKDMVGDQCALSFEGQGGKFKPYAPYTVTALTTPRLFVASLR